MTPPHTQITHHFFFSQSILERLVAHMATHRSVVYRCNQANCGKEFRIKIHLARHYQQSHPSNGRSDSPRPIMKTRAAFLVRTSPAAKLARTQFPDLVCLKHLSKNPFTQLNVQQIKQESKCDC